MSSGGRVSDWSESRLDYSDACMHYLLETQGFAVRILSQEPPFKNPQLDDFTEERQTPFRAASGTVSKSVSKTGQSPAAHSLQNHYSATAR
jgi:hypothetical protein